MPGPVGGFAIDAMTRYEEAYGKLIGFVPYGIAQASDSNGAVYQYQALLNFDSGKQIPYPAGEKQSGWI